MASLENLPADQRAVLELVLRQGRSYDEIAKLLSIDRAGVRQRAQAAFDALGPQTQLPTERRALIADYLLGQLPSRLSENVRDRLGSSPSERAWARMVAAELTPLSREPLPEIPVTPPVGAASVAQADPGAGPSAGVDPSTGVGPSPGDAPGAGGGPPSDEGRSPLFGAGRSSRRGGVILLGVGALVAIAVVVVLVVALSGSSTPKRTSTTTAHTSSSGTTASSSSSTKATVVGQVNLLSPASGSLAKGVAQVIRVGNSEGIVIYATGVPANTKQNFYAVWLYNSPTDEFNLGYVNPGVSSDGRLQTTGALPTNVSHYKQLVVSLETQRKPKTPSKIVLRGALTLG